MSTSVLKFIFTFLLSFTYGACFSQAPFDVVAKSLYRTDSLEISVKDVFDKIEDSALVFTYTVDNRGNVLDSAMAMLVNNVANCKYGSLPIYNSNLNLHVQVRFNNQIILEGNYRSISEIDSTGTKLIPLVENPLKEPFSFYPESGKLLSGFTQKIKMLPNFPTKDFVGNVKLYDNIGNKLADFAFKEQRELQITMPDTGALRFTVNDTLTMWLYGSRKGYAICISSIADSINIKLYRGLDEPASQFELILQTDSSRYVILNSPRDEDVYIFSTIIPKSIIDDKDYALKLYNADKTHLVTRLVSPFANQELNWPMFRENTNSQVLADASFAREFIFISKVKKPVISYQVNNDLGDLVDLGSVDWINDSLFAIKQLQLFGNGNIIFSIAKTELYGNEFSITSKLASDYTSIRDFFITNKKNTPALAKQIIGDEVYVQPKGKFTLPNVTVRTETKKRIEELEEKYVNSYMFKQLFERKINVLDDEQARNGMHIFDYIAMRYPILRVKYRQIDFPIARRVKSLGVQFYVDEVFTDEVVVADMPVSEVAYIKIFNNPIRGTGNRAIAIYTRKGNETVPNPFLKYQLPLIGIQK